MDGMGAFLSRVLLCAILLGLQACGGGGPDAVAQMQDDLPEIPSVPRSSQATMDVGTADVPEVEEPTNNLLLTLLQECVGIVLDGELQLAQQCNLSSRHEELLDWSLRLYSRAITADPRILGRDLPAVIYKSGPIALDGSVVNVLLCSNDPTGGGNVMNAVALQDVVAMLDPLLDALCEGAALWDRFRQDAGGDPDNADFEAFIAGLFEIFKANANGQFGTVVPPNEIEARITGSPFAFEAYWGAVSFVLYHELGHANLEHGLLKCLVQKGVAAALDDAGITPTPAEQQELEAALAKISRATEAQADIYAATIMEHLGFSTNGPALVILGFLVMALEPCAPFLDVSEEAFQNCLVGTAPGDTHPGLAERANIIQRIMVNKEDLTPLLTVVEALRIN